MFQKPAYFCPPNVDLSGQRTRVQIEGQISLKSACNRIDNFNANFVTKLSKLKVTRLQFFVLNSLSRMRAKQNKYPQVGQKYRRRESQQKE